MTQRPQTAPGDVGRTYDTFAEAGTTNALGGNIHVGYWADGAGSGIPVDEATDRLTDLVADRLAPEHGTHLLDVGCGNGVPALRIAASRGVRVTGVTVSAQQVREASARARDHRVGGRTAFLLADAVDLPFEDASFDGAWAIESLLHIGDRTAALAELHRVVRPGGRLVVADLCLRRPFTGVDRELLDGMLGMYEIASISTSEEHRTHLARSGWRLGELADIGEQVRPSYGHAAAAFREIAASPDAPAAERLTEAAELMTAFGEHPDTGYALITAHRT